MPDISEIFYNLAMANSSMGWISLGIDIILTTLVGGIVLLVLVELLGKKWGEAIKPANAFFVILVINIINLVGIVGMLSAIIPLGSLIAPLVVWILLVKVFFSEMPWKHVALVGIVGYLLSIFLVPYLIGYVSSYLPKF